MLKNQVNVSGLITLPFIAVLLLTPVVIIAGMIWVIVTLITSLTGGC